MVLFPTAEGNPSSKNNQLNALTDISQHILTTHTTPDEVLNLILHYALTLLALPKGVIVLFKHYTTLVQTLYTYGIQSPERAKQLLEENWEYEVTAYRENGYLAFETIPGGFTNLLAWTKEENIASALNVALWMQEQVTGMLIFLDTRPHSWTQEEIDTALLLAVQGSIALEKTLLVQEVEQRLRELEQVHARLKQFDKMKSEFIQNVSHELRTPLTIITGYVDLIADNGTASPGNENIQLDPKLTRIISAIQQQTAHLVTLVESITSLQEGQIGHIDLLPQPLLPVCLAAIQSVWQRAHRQGIQLVQELPNQLPTVALDAEYLGRALIYILDNAIKFNHDHGKVWIRAWVEGGTACIQITDEGIGIPETELERIFERFYQVDGSIRRAYGGMGLGLSVAKEIITHHKGQIWAESSGKDKGATVTVTLPVFTETIWSKL
ncbi:MAG: GAF domain-containing sensor histidine kinase [Anaerolineae bacterium]|nr:GAF domain-containing sensor histidine kinase [Anaerolineae bacterium]